jgi:hypothetical protein
MGIAGSGGWRYRRARFRILGGFLEYFFEHGKQAGGISSSDFLRLTPEVAPQKSGVRVGFYFRAITELFPAYAVLFCLPLEFGC